MHRVANGLTLLLALAVAAAAGLHAWLLQDPLRGVAVAMEAPESTSGGDSDVGPLPTGVDSRALRADVDTAAVNERPLFTEGRRPPPPAERRAVTPAVRQAPFTYTLEGIATRGTRRVVLLRSNNGIVHHRLTEGETLDGWQLLRIDADQAEFASGEDRLVLELEPAGASGDSTIEWRKVERN